MKFWLEKFVRQKVKLNSTFIIEQLYVGVGNVFARHRSRVLFGTKVEDVGGQSKE